MNERPLLLRLLPPRLREPVVHRAYLARAREHPALFRGARLHFAPRVRMDLAPTDVGHAVIAFAGLFEYKLSRRIHALARRGGLFVDVGANYGYYSLLWAAARDDNHVLALEASPRNIAPLEHNVQANGFRERVRVLQVAAGRERGPLALDLGPSDQTGWGGIATPGQADTIEVQGVTLDELLSGEGLTTVAALKIDVEGADAWVLQGAERMLREQRIAHVFFERNDTRMAALAIDWGELLRLLGSCGYRARRISANEWYAWPQRPR